MLIPRELSRVLTSTVKAGRLVGRLCDCKAIAAERRQRLLPRAHNSRTSVRMTSYTQQPFSACDTWFPELRCRCHIRSRIRKNRVRTCVPYAVARCVRGSSAAGPGGRPPSFPRKRVGGAPGAYERQVRKNRIRSYMNG